MDMYINQNPTHIPHYSHSLKHRENVSPHLKIISLENISTRLGFFRRKTAPTWLLSPENSRKQHSRLGFYRNQLDRLGFYWNQLERLGFLRTQLDRLGFHVSELENLQ